MQRSMKTTLYLSSCALYWLLVVVASANDDKAGPRRLLRYEKDEPFDDDNDLQLPPPDRRRRLPSQQNARVTFDSTKDRTKLFLKRMVMHCDPIFDLQTCWEAVSHTGENIVLKRRLAGLHALAVEIDGNTVEDLSKVGFYFTEDMERETMAIEESLQYQNHRTLQEGQQVGYGVDLIRASNVWDQYNVRGEGVKVCIMDTGVYLNHPDLDSNHFEGWSSIEDFVTPWSEDVTGHGTHIAGILAASDNNRGYVGIAPGVDVYVVRVFTDEGRFFGSDVVAAAEACRDAGSNFISMSLGGQGFDDGENEIFQDLYENHGIISVASAGNTGGPELIYPAGYSFVVSVTACNQNRRLPDFATFNSFVDIAAPGANIPSTYIPSRDGGSNEAYATLSGTSMAGPHVLGALALMKSFAPRATADELLYALKQSTRKLASNINVGLVDALAAVQMLDAGVDLGRVSSSPCQNVELSMKTDQWGQETAYRLRRLSDRTVLWRGIGLQSHTDYRESSCVDPSDCYEFIIRDSYGDGIAQPGRIRLVYGNEVKLDDGGFGKGGKIVFGQGCPR